MEFDAHKIKARARAAVHAGLYRAGELVARKSLEAVPKKSGALACSIFIDGGNADNPSVVVGYGATYAQIQHEDTEFEHENGEPKFLTNPLFEQKSNCINIIANSVKEALR